MGKIEVTEPIVLPDGVHEGLITKVEDYTSPPPKNYKYTHIWVKEKVTELEIKYGVPTSGSVAGKLMKLLGTFTRIVPGLVVEPDRILVGKEVTFMTLTEENDNGKFARIVDGSLKPKAKTNGTAKPQPKEDEVFTEEEVIEG